jgi:hypothetical protein
MTHHRTLGSVHIKGQSDHQAVYLTAAQSYSDSFQVGGKGAAFEGAQGMHRHPVGIGHGDADSAPTQV